MLPLLTQSVLSHTSSTYDIIVVVVGETVMCTNSTDCESLTDDGTVVVVATVAATVVVVVLFCFFSIVKSG